MSEPPHDASPPARPWAGWRAFVAVFVPAFVLIASWSLAMPRDTGPDEPSHVVHAAGVVRGELTGTAIPHFAGWLKVTVPAPYAFGIDQDRCYQSSALTPASCERPWPTVPGTAVGLTYTGHYPPAYYALVGVPTLLTSSVQGFYAMRIVSALLASILYGLAGLAVVRWSRQRLLGLGLLVALTPMALYSAAVVNPSSLEISAALCLWVSGIVLVRERLDSPPTGLVAIVAVSAAALAAARAISPLWLLVIGVALLALGDLRSIGAAVRRTGSLKWGIALVAAVVAGSVLWTVFAHALDVQQGLVRLGPHATAFDVLKAAIKREGVWAEELVGIFGSHEVLSPLPTYVAWWAVGGLVTCAGLARGRRREAWTILSIGAVCVVAPVALQFLHARDLGIVWQGRYTLPVAVGLPVVSTAVLGDATSSRPKLVAAAFVVLPLASFLAFGEALRRYAVGVDGPILYDHPAWQPPGGVACWLCVNLVATGVLAYALWRVAAARGDRRVSPVADRGTPAAVRLSPRGA